MCSWSENNLRKTSLTYLSSLFMFCCKWNSSLSNLNNLRMIPLGMHLSNWTLVGDRRLYIWIRNNEVLTNENLPLHHAQHSCMSSRTLNLEILLLKLEWKESITCFKTLCPCLTNVLCRQITRCWTQHMIIDDTYSSFCSICENLFNWWISRTLVQNTACSTSLDTGPACSRCPYVLCLFSRTPFWWFLLAAQ